MAPDKTIGINSQSRPVMPPATDKPTTVPTVPTPRMVATIPATEVVEAAWLTVPLAMALFSIVVNTPRSEEPIILLTSTASVQTI